MVPESMQGVQSDLGRTVIEDVNSPEKLSSGALPSDSHFVPVVFGKCWKKEQLILNLTDYSFHEQHATAYPKPSDLPPLAAS